MFDESGSATLAVVMADVYCFICGANAEVADQLETDLADVAYTCGARLSAAARRAFLFGPADRTFQTALGLCAPLDLYGDELYDPSAPDARALRSLPAASARLLRGVAPGARHAYAEVRHLRSGRQYWLTAHSHIFAHAACFQLLSATMGGPPGWVPRFWACVRKANFAHPAANGICGVDYGAAVDATQGPGAVVPLGNLGSPPLPPYIRTALAAPRPDPEVVRDFWLGQGAMWVFVRPDVFPIREALESSFALTSYKPQSFTCTGLSRLEDLPVELLSSISCLLGSLSNAMALLCVSKTLRYKLLGSADILARHLLPSAWLPPFVQPYIDIEDMRLGPGEEVILAGDMELDDDVPEPPSTPDSEPVSWCFSPQGSTITDTPATTPTSSCGSGARCFPWLAYARACAGSASMRNRARILWICTQIARLANELTLDDMEGTAEYPLPD